MEIFTTVIKIGALCAAAYFAFNIARLLITAVRPGSNDPTDLLPIDTEFGQLSINPDEGAEDWILDREYDSFRIHILGTPPDLDLLRFISVIMDHKDKIEAQIESQDSSVVGTELHLLYCKKGTCYFDINLPDQEIQMGYNERRGVYAL